MALAFSTIAGVVAAIVALSPVALRRGPEGRRLTTIGRPRPVGAPDRARGTEKALPS